MICDPFTIFLPKTATTTRKRTRKAWWEVTFLPVVPQLRRSQSVEKEGKKSSPDLQKLVLQSLASGEDSKDVLTLAVLSQLLAKKKRKKGKASSSHDPLGGSSSDDSSGDPDDLAGRGMRAVNTLHKLRNRIERKPKHIIEEFERDIIKELGIVPGQAWTVRDYVKCQQWVRFKGLYRAAMMDAAVYEWRRNGKPEVAAAQTIQNLKSNLQAVLQNGEWETAWLLTGLQEWSGTREEMSIISGYVEALSKLKKKVKDTQGGGDRNDDQGPVAPGGDIESWHARGQVLSYRHPCLKGRSSKFLRFVTWFESVQGSLPERSGDGVPWFPMVLPYPEVLLIEMMDDEAQACKVWAKKLLNILVSWSNFVCLGCPGEPIGPRVVYRSLEEARLCAGRLLSETEQFATPNLFLGRLHCEGTRATVEALLRSVRAWQVHVIPITSFRRTLLLPLLCRSRQNVWQCRRRPAW